MRTKNKIFALIISLVIALIGGCRNDDLTFRIINNRRENISITYDDRMYRSDLETKFPTLVSTLLNPDSSFFMGVGSDKEDIWPSYLEIRVQSDTIIIKGRDAIMSLTKNNKIVIE
jgi:hypothetical protein